MLDGPRQWRSDWTGTADNRQLFWHPARDSRGTGIAFLYLRVTVADDSFFDMPDDLETLESKQTLYFGYGSNVWLDQMNRRCPENKYIGTAVLHDWYLSTCLVLISPRTHLLHLIGVG